MHPVIERSFGGLSRAYYLRQFFFGLLLFALFMFLASRSPRGIPTSGAVFLALSALLYPYSRFVYERVVGFVVGDNVFLVNAAVMLAMKLLTMGLCFVFAVFIAPVGLLYLYLRS
jgi:hypothetical protein